MSASHKRCTKCGEEKPRDEFSKRTESRDGLQSHCKRCKRAYRVASADSYREYRREYNATNADRLSEYHREYRAANAERIRETKRAHYTANADQVLAKCHTYYKENRERVSETNRAYKLANPDVVARSNAKRRALKASVEHEPYARAEIFARWSGCCYCDAPAEHLDHVTPISRQGADAEWNLVPACVKCNSSKGAKTLAEWAATF